MRRCFLPLLALSAVGCGSEFPTPAHAERAHPTAPVTAFDPAGAGTVTGRVVWRGPLPDVPTFSYPVRQPDGEEVSHTAENPNRPRIEPRTKAVRGAVVFLRGVDPSAARPWNLPPVRVEMRDGRITVVQGERRGRVGFVRRGDSFSAASTEPMFHLLRGRGDAFFGLTLPECDSPVARTLTKAGRVELSSGTGLYWARADLFVADHPYFTVTGPDGRFTLAGVPAGKVEVVAWLPGWTAARKERDVENTRFARMTYAPPVERAATVGVEPGGTADAQLTLP